MATSSSAPGAGLARLRCAPSRLLPGSGHFRLRHLFLYVALDRAGGQHRSGPISSGLPAQSGRIDKISGSASHRTAAATGGAVNIARAIAPRTPSDRPTPERRSLRWVRTVRLRNRSRVPEVRIVGGKPLRSL